ncbi:MAG: DNA polymerase III subunit gamma/tau [Candidatus Amulumruptor caecigallinarius]|nr:DNA polymerase III subunit gamma/tau [Candidatus Amulumruptor caecigallinarius]
MSNQYIVSARKYRPATFRTVVGQQNLTSTLKGAISSGRLAHAYLFCGPRGVGKTSCARIFARTINCMSPTADGEACGRCKSCRSIDEGNSFNIVELDAASNNGVNDIRAITEQVNVPPQLGKYRVFIIDEVHMLSSQAFNAFLKTLEEPPSYAVFILATTEKHKVIPTILSRCQIYDFKRITIDDIVDHLAYVATEEHIETDRRALGVIARKADGAMRDALSIFDQVSASAGGKLTYEAVVENLNVLDYEYFFKLVDAFATGNVQDALLLYKEVRDRGFDSLFFINSLAQHIRDLMVAADSRTVTLLETPEDVSKRLVEQARALPLQWYYAAMRLLNECDLNYRTSSNKQLLVELTLIRLCQLTKPATPPFDISDRPVALRNISETSVATNSSSPESSLPSESSKSLQAAQSFQPSRSLKPHSLPRQQGSDRPSTVRLSDISAAKIHSSNERQHNDFSDADFQRAWGDYMTQNPSQHILVTAMRKGNPKRTGEDEFTVTVDHPAEQQAFESSMQPMLAFLKEKLANDFIVIKTVYNQEKEHSRFLSPHEFLKKAVESNPHLGEFLQQIDAGLA